MAAEALASPGGKALLADAPATSQEDGRLASASTSTSRLTILGRTMHDGKMLMKNANESAKIRSQKQ